MAKQGSASLTKRRLRRAADAAASTFPALMIEAHKVAQTVSAGLHGRRRAGPGETFWQHRPYAFGDPVGAIDWRQSARAADRLFVRQNEWEAPAAVFMWRDASASMDYASAPSGATKAWRADVLAAALAILLSEAGERIALLGSSMRPVAGRAAPARIIDEMHAFEGPAEAMPPRAETPPSARLVLISDFLFDASALQSTVSAYAAAGAGGLLIAVADPAEAEFPFAGRTEFRDLESRDVMTFGDAGAVAASYRALYAAHQGAVADVARRFGWRHIAHRTDRPPEAALLAAFVALAGDAPGR